MPRVASFYGVTVSMYYNDHTPAHFHALYAEHEAEIRIDTLEVIKGSLPRRAMALVLEWGAGHRSELAVAWDRARRHEPLGTIDPLE